LYFGGDNSEKLSFYLLFSFFLVPFKILQKMWTGGQVRKILRKQFQPHLFHHLKVWTVGKRLSFYFMFSFSPSKFWQKVWTGGQEMKILNKIDSTSCIFLFESVDMWTRRCLSISCFLSVCTLHNFDEKVWTGGPVMKILKKSFNLLYFTTWQCRLVDKKVSFYFISPFYLVHFKILTKVWTGGQVMKNLT
jgi:hypothetical protein